MNQLMSDEAVYRTAPATRGLLKSINAPKAQLIQPNYKVAKENIVFILRNQIKHLHTNTL